VLPSVAYDALWMCTLLVAPSPQGTSSQYPRESTPQAWEHLCDCAALPSQGIIQELAPLLAPAQTGDHPEDAARVETLWWAAAHLRLTQPANLPIGT
jgi:hypothetical protein